VFGKELPISKVVIFTPPTGNSS